MYYVIFILDKINEGKIEVPELNKGFINEDTRHSTKIVKAYIGQSYNYKRYVINPKSSYARA